MAQAGQTEGEAGAGGRVATLAGHYDIFVDRPIAELQTSYAMAYVASDRQFPATNLFAMIGMAELPPRLEVLETLHGMRLEGMMVPLEWGVVPWPLTNRRVFAIIYDRPAGGLAFTSIDQPFEPIPEDELVHGLMPPMVYSLKEFFPGGATHRAIRATNLYYRDAAHRQLMFGDCCSTPPAYGQPVLYETIESGLAGPWGRGNGQPSDDLYSFGVTLLLLLLGRNPAAHLTDEQLLEEKINRGSYAAIVGNERLSSTMTEPIRGLLTDDPKERWSIQELELWVLGRRLSPKQPSLPKRATRGFEFSGGSYLTARALAHAFSRNPTVAAQTVKAPDFEIWLNRSLADPDRTKMMSSALSEAQDLGAGSQYERLAARAVIALDPVGPVRYKGFAACIDGFGSALAGSYRGQGATGPIAEAIASRLPVFWFSAQPGLKPEQVPILKSFERVRFHLEDRRPGFGPERVLYELNLSVHCLSPLIESYYVLDPHGVLPALEASLEKQPDQEMVIDRHLAAFIGARVKQAPLEWFDDLASSSPANRTLGTLKILSHLQSVRGPDIARNTCERVARQLPAVVETFHNRARRRQMLDEIPRVASRGSLAELLALVDSVAERQRDALGFSAAVREYAMVDRALEQWRADQPRRPKRSAQLGARIASGASTFLAWASVLILLVVMD
ncbi:MAG TPA: serine/threonine protein kinase [Stellaceae bacterium]|nr:serine/threonine protein kinase [Stellaceae bacterium]